MTINAVPAPDRLSERLRRCVDQTIEAEALEGWQPTADHVDALVALVNDDVTFDDYLAEYRTRYPPGPTRASARRMNRRSRPYLIPGTTLLRNNFGADTHEMLADLEFVSTAGRIAGWHRRLADGDVSADELGIRCSTSSCSPMSTHGQALTASPTCVWAMTSSCGNRLWSR